ncbi:hypothetical protein jhhlp_002235 [Lomentospora prolificans]|uniref:Aminoglycoside phosphotransferase domain-containing protein n=1 Tax=Lomentospora prolificans TaxID=41688 RepID=A0A2N3NDI7_9PEZI|nr:hypothetical protein jhhlp_002235 [Lomentospora prolificans]
MAGPIRHPINQANLERYLEEHVPEIKTPLDIKQFGFGQSNPTYQLTSATGIRYVLRKKPPGKLLSKAAHKVEREYRVMRAIGEANAKGSSGVQVPVPKTYCLCEDDTVVGTPFYVMEFLDGRIFEDFSIPEVDAKTRTAMWTDAVRTLAKLHSIDPASIGLASFGKDTDFYTRQIKTWSTICEAQSAVRDVDSGALVGPLPHMEELVSYFADPERQPADRATLVHGDFKIDNLVFHKTEPRVIGILECTKKKSMRKVEKSAPINDARSWEMSTIGHPLSDLSNLLTAFTTAPATDSPLTTAKSSLSNPAFVPGKTPGLPTRGELIAMYASASASAAQGKGTGYDPRPGGEVSWGAAFNLFRLAAVCQGIAARHAVRQASSAKAAIHAAERGPLAELAWALIVDREKERKGNKARL